MAAFQIICFPFVSRTTACKCDAKPTAARHTGLAEFSWVVAKDALPPLHRNARCHSASSGKNTSASPSLSGNEITSPVFGFCDSVFRACNYVDVGNGRNVSSPFFQWNLCRLGISTQGEARNVQLISHG
jgi:hypothetical protein